MKLYLTFLLLLGTFSNSIGQDLEQQLLLLDEQWEKSLLTSDLEFLKKILADDFVWVHNHASLIEGKGPVVNRAKRILEGQPDNTKSRTTQNRSVILLNDTGVVTGFTLVDRGESPVKYHFMRTYVRVNGEFLLLANHTMAVPQEELTSLTRTP